MNDSEMREIGKVVKLQDKLVTVQFPRKSTCDHCNMCLVKPNEAHVNMTLENTLDCKMGDKVEVNISQGTVLKMSLLLYVFPLVIGLIGFLTAYWLGVQEVVQMIAFVAALAVGFLLLRVFDKLYAVSKKGKPYLVRVVEENEENIQEEINEEEVE